ncbi:MAG: hypothetical protein A2268_03210 [Candidatus Raymondbacteria bacterium RifOxyA12_full_50_37]|uniref:DUF5723 domain-containing protein n=1 Tax=Candidatus Raymondbacteria bacterium RIFOXYD12_FULL_49_13 TaxID=1817890 RepID=A0A1F7F891_UNCRA|nr:MAG: hypothetical protein A2268_03210 [Candidatus Raymondbacteria bacterium RifOxyA12_full_50_37]OGJ86748.1 MAG: hypothetical protein A2248_09940 [Candidatus Raymondbacteria bacterium RIFOXYA2_FULL_49_16]OGK01553.1 MAG: hypothetical protein A2350_06480 [Candidatus Raymondbacteria bacterium RifOxyB12_full_50_8]OGK02841.1 MAG: hypothetical protein A2519_06650 [Candidatus Raymondbacteria bacterium RIFOXYD12_FULL_49_13]OGK03574.1 MAG: hypothetical protein A2487_05055 [Candidatus Raymondbacteria 
MIKKYLLTGFVGALCVLSVFAETRSTFTGIRSMGMGGANLANADDASAMLVNPACLDMYMEHMHLSVNFGLYVSPSVLDLLSFVTNHSKKLTSTDGLKSLDKQFYDDLYSIDGKWSTVGLLPNAGFMARTLGFTYGASYYWTVPTRVMIESGVLVPKIFIGTQMDQVFTASMCRRLMKVLAVGASFKWIDRYIVDDIALGYTQTLEFVDRFNNDMMSAIDPLLTHKYGPGFDIGGLFYFGGIRAAATIQDVFAYIGEDFLSPRFNVGMAYKILPLMEYNFIDDASATFELHNVFRHANFFTKINTGAEIRLTNFDFRMGLNQGYPTLGMSLYYFIFHLDYLWYAEELGLYVNDSPLSYHFIQLGADIKF